MSPHGGDADNGKEPVMTHVDIPFLRYLDEEGRPVATLPTWLDKAMLHLLPQHGDGAQLRQESDSTAANRQTRHLSPHLGGGSGGDRVGLAMQPEDVYVPYYRDMPTLYVRACPWSRTCSIGAAMNGQCLLQGRWRVVGRLAHLRSPSPPRSPMLPASRPPSSCATSPESPW